jgi:glycosyltransferase involved in cell wall biosynthesis
MVQELGLKNTLFLPPIPRYESPGYLAMADAFLLPNRRGDFFRMNLPNKLFDFLMSGRPIVVAGEGETADIIRAANAGLVVPAEDSWAVADALRKLIALAVETRQKMGENAREYVIKHYDRKIKLGELEQVFASVRN